MSEEEDAYYVKNLNKEKKKVSQEKMNEEQLKKTLEEIKKDKKIENKKEDKKKKAKWWSKVFNKDKLKKSNKVAVIYLRNNGNADLTELQTRNGFFAIEGRTYHEDRDCVYTITKDRIPLLIVREWDIIPLGTKKWDDELMREKFSELEQHVLKGIRAAELVKAGGGTDLGLTPKQIILWGLAALVGVVIIVNVI